MAFDTMGTPDNYATVEINGNTGVLTLKDGKVITMSITPMYTEFCSGAYNWTGSPAGNGELGVVGTNSSKITIYGVKYGSMNINDERTYYDRLDFVKSDFVKSGTPTPTPTAVQAQESFASPTSHPSVTITFNRDLTI